MKKTGRYGFVAILLLAVLAIRRVPYAVAYLSDAAEPLKNTVTIAQDVTSKIVEKYPDDQTIDTDSSAVSYEKSVQVVNSGYVDEYVRVRIAFTEEDIRDKTSFSWDGSNYYTVSEYSSHLPSGWVYNAGDSYYYYTPIVRAGDWTSFQSTLTYISSTGHYEYGQEDEIAESEMITVPLIRYVRTQFEDAKDMRSYGVIVYNESCPYYLGSDYVSAWENYLDTE